MADSEWQVYASHRRRRTHLALASVRGRSALRTTAPRKAPPAGEGTANAPQSDYPILACPAGGCSR